MRQLPKVTCLLPTRDRFSLFKQSVASYCRQTYSNKELVICSEGSDDYKANIARHVADLARGDIRCVFVGGQDWNLGKMRNLTLDHARGDIVCQWDDDDMCHPLRLERQVQALLEQGAVACFLTEQLQYFYNRNELYWVNWDYDKARPLRSHVIPGTMMCFRSAGARYPESGPDSTCNEDMIFLDQLIATGHIAKLASEAYLYVYTFHGRNVYDFEHHWKIVELRERLFTSDWLCAQREMLERELAQYDWPQREIPICGKTGVAFVYNHELTLAAGVPPAGQRRWANCAR